MVQPLPRATPELAKTVWQGQQSPSARSVARALTQSGRPVHFTTVSRWRRCGWRAEPTEHPLDQARADLESALPLVTDDPTTTIDDLIRTSPDGAELEQLSDSELLRKADREMARAVYVLSQAVMHQPELVVTKPTELGILLGSLAACAREVTAGFEQAEKMQAIERTPANTSTRG
jgi:hypothetical protein